MSEYKSIGAIIEQFDNMRKELRELEDGLRNLRDAMGHDWGDRRWQENIDLDARASVKLLYTAYVKLEGEMQVFLNTQVVLA